MSLIEQAAKRLEQLRKAGIEVPERTGSTEPGAAGQGDTVPLRVVTELDSRKEPRFEPTRPRPPVEAKSVAPTAPVDNSDSAGYVEIDLPRLSASGYITPNAPRSRMAEEFRVIKRPLMNNISGKSGQPVVRANRIMVTSALPGEGKTYVSLNLAMSLAMELNTEVLLVDADASRPALLERLGLGQSNGLLDLLVEPDLSPRSLILKTNVEHLSILPAGNPQLRATELLASESMSRLVEQLANDDPHRVVLFDTPPLLAASESRVLAAHMGQIIMVIGADATPQGTVAEALATLDSCPVVFTLLNRVEQSDRSSYYGSYGAYAK